ncbi:hypothetical protein HDF26_001353 [Pedobacter cryoconitis]|uniref:DUF2784 domain-containing protein n=1 Tax=Pedobacter cryoconitis TaxID=188932 RepID=UPI001620F46D|nr:DUF2784 domain-containing protein [Pedobacter cryoconitis]MBB6270926.1 hypothetical protein [Pedobacter cryoconitis]
MYHLLDWFFTLLHLVIIGFNLLGWIWPSTRKLHLIVVALTLGCWLILGIWYGLGYCPVTDWQWQIKESLGETNLPNSFVKYYADKISGRSISSVLIDSITGISFATAIMITVYVNFIKKRR